MSAISFWTSLLGAACCWTLALSADRAWCSASAFLWACEQQNREGGREERSARGVEQGSGPGGNAADLLRFSPRHSHDAADALGDGLLRDDDKRSGVSRVLQVAAEERQDRAQQRDRISRVGPLQRAGAAGGAPCASTTPTVTHVPPQNSMEVSDPAVLSGSFSSSSTGMPMDTTRTGSG